MKMQATLGIPFLTFVYSLSLFLVGGAIGAKCHGRPVLACSLALLGAALMVIHDISISLVWMWLGARWSDALAGRRAHK